MKKNRSSLPPLQGGLGHINFYKGWEGEGGAARKAEKEKPE